MNAAAWRAAYDFLPDAVRPSTDYRPEASRVDSLLENLRDRDAPLFVATRDGRVRGFAELRWGRDETDSFVPAGAAELKALYVHPDDWGDGIGSRLLTAAVFAVPPTRNRLVLQTFRENDDARRFYERRGFVAAGESTFRVDGRTFPTVVYSRAVE